MPTARVPANRRQRARLGQVHQLPSGAWSVRVTENGKRRRLTGGPWDTEDQAYDELTRWSAQRLDGTQARRDLALTPLRTVYERCVEALGGPNSNSDRSVFYRNVITGEAGVWVGAVGTRDRRKVTPVPGRMILGDIPVGEITIETIEQWATSLRNGPHKLSPSTITKWGRHLSQAMEWAKVRGYIPVNPVDAAVLVPRGAVAESRPPRFFLTLKEMVVLTMATPIEHLDMMETLLWSGLRQSEVRALRPESIRDAASILSIDKAVENTSPPRLGPTKTRGSVRRVAIPHGVMWRLREWAIEGHVLPGQPYFPGKNGQGWMRGDDFNEAFASIREKAGVMGDLADDNRGRRKPPTPHDCRATGASILFAAGAGVPEVQAWLGHTSPQITLGLYTEVQQFGREDQILTRLRGQSLSVPQILDAVYDAAWRAYGDPDHPYWPFK